MNTIKKLLLVAVIFSSFFPNGRVDSATPSAEDLIHTVNALRANNRLPAIPVDAALNAAAKTQSDYLASFYDTNYPSWDMGHVGAGGTYARDRAVAAGYPLAAGMNVTENWAGGNSSTTISQVVYTMWADESHWNTMMHPDAVGVGAGISKGAGGSVYFILVVALRYGSGGSSPGVISTIPTTAVTAPIALVKVSTPQADGSIIHVVQGGQALWNIAVAYEVSVEQIKSLNNLTSDIITTGQKLLVQVASTATPTPTATLTPRPPTRTPVPPQTAEAVITPTTEDTPSQEGLLGMDRRTMGLVLILICGAGLALVVFGTMSKDKQPPKDK